MVILDTNIIIDHLRQPEGADTAFRIISRQIAKEDLALSVVSVQELWEARSTREKKKEDERDSSSHGATTLGRAESGVRCHDIRSTDQWPAGRAGHLRASD